MSNCYRLVLGLRGSLLESNSLAGDTGWRIDGCCLGMICKKTKKVIWSKVFNTTLLVWPLYVKYLYKWMDYGWRLYILHI